MQPQTSRDFLKVAEQRLNAAEALFAADLTLDAQYVGGYAIECSLKALILEKTALPDRPDKLMRISSGATMHKAETLLQELRASVFDLPQNWRRDCGDSTGTLIYVTKQGGETEVRREDFSEPVSKYVIGSKVRYHDNKPKI